jgi:hypothetical protein
MLTELIVHGISRFSRPTAQPYQAYRKAGASGSRPLLARGSVAAAR